MSKEPNVTCLRLHRNADLIRQLGVNARRKRKWTNLTDLHTFGDMFRGLGAAGNGPVDLIRDAEPERTSWTDIGWYGPDADGHPAGLGPYISAGERHDTPEWVGLFQDGTWTPMTVNQRRRLLPENDRGLCRRIFLRKETVLWLSFVEDVISAGGGAPWAHLREQDNSAAASGMNR